MSKDFNLVYRSFVCELIRELRRSLFSLGINPTDQMLSKFLSVQPNTVCRLRRGCFNASPRVLVSLMAALPVHVYSTVFNKHFGYLRNSHNDLFAEFCEVDERIVQVDGIKFNSDTEGCPIDCHGDCEFCVKG